MYKIKQIPKDFIVREESDRDFSEEGAYLICLMKKTSYNTEDAIQRLCESLHVTRKNVSYAGTKDRNAITYQYISLFKGTKERIVNSVLKDISVEIIGRSKSPLSLGDLKGNSFEITIRNLEPKVTINKIEKFPNYFDKQRFSTNNIERGQALVKKNFQKACKLIITDNQYGTIIKKALEKQPKNYIQALSNLPSKILLIYVHAFQSFIWNKTVEEYFKTKKNNRLEKIPLVGFSDLEENEVKPIIEKILNEEELSNRDFIIREMPAISLEGASRKLFSNIENLKVGDLKEDDLNQGKKKIKLEFFLEKGSYATMAVSYLLKET